MKILLAGRTRLDFDLVKGGVTVLGIGTEVVTKRGWIGKITLQCPPNNPRRRGRVGVTFSGHKEQWHRECKLTIVTPSWWRHEIDRSVEAVNAMFGRPPDYRYRSRWGEL